MFPAKFQNHKHYDEIIEHFKKGTKYKDISAWLTTLGEEHKLSGDTLSRHKRHWTENRKVNKEVERVQKEMGEPGNEIESFLLETITQCRLKKKHPTIGGKDYQYYDQQMQSAIKLLQEVRAGSHKTTADIQDIFKKLTEGILDENEGTNTEGTDNTVSGELHETKQ